LSFSAIRRSASVSGDKGNFDCPTRIAVIQALTAFDVPRDRIKVLSLGCVESRYSVDWLQRALGGKVFWAGNMIEAAAHMPECTR
jgi:hypothetical protein